VAAGKVLRISFQQIEELAGVLLKWV
jgi:hypothetical protein